MLYSPFGACARNPGHRRVGAPDNPLPGAKIVVLLHQAEEFLTKLGFTHIRVRSYGTLARIEVEPSQITLLAQVNTRNKVIARFKELGYNYVTLDLAGFRSGSMDVSLANNLRNC